MIHCMVDLETLGTTADAAIAQIGAVAFDESEIVSRFQVNITVAYADERVINAETVMWWLQQPKEVINEVFFKPSFPLFNSLHMFEGWYTGWNCSTLWGNGAMFDNAILEDVYKQMNIKAPWTYRHHRCFRTIKECFKGTVPEPTRDENAKHIAVVDAEHQAKWLQQIHAKVGGIL